MKRSLCLLLIPWLTLAGCGTAVYRPGAAAGFRLDPETEIDDDDIRKAFEARPQLQTPARIAFLAFGEERATEVEAMLRALPGVTDVYRIPEFLATGKRATLVEEQSEGYGAYGGPYQPNPAPSIKKLRLLAARAHCDLLLIFDYGRDFRTEPNGWVALNILLLPALFTPFIDARMVSGIDAYLMDVRNGYLYLQASAREKGQRESLTIYGVDRAREELAEQQWRVVLEQSQVALRETLARAAAPAPSTLGAPAGAPAAAAATPTITTTPASPAATTPAPAALTPPAPPAPSSTAP